MNKRRRTPEVLWNLVISLVVVVALRVALISIVPFDHWRIELPIEAAVVVITSGLIFALRLLFAARRHVLLLRRISSHERFGSEESDWLLEAMERLQYALEHNSVDAAARDWLTASFKQLTDIAALNAREAQGPLLMWVTHSLTAADSGIQHLLGDSGWTVGETTFNEIMKELTKQGTGSYVGTTADLPSVFLERYPWIRERDPEAQRAFRILIVTSEDLRRDAQSDPKGFRDFVNWHESHNVLALCLKPADYIKLKQHYRFGKYLTKWESYAIVLEPHDGGEGEREVNARLIPVSDPRFEDLSRYVRRIQEKRSPLDGDSYMKRDDV